METTFFPHYVYLLFSFYAKTNDELWMYSSLSFFFFFFSDPIISSASCEMNRVLHIVLIQTNTMLILWRGTETQTEINQHMVKSNVVRYIAEWKVNCLFFHSSVSHLHRQIYTLDLFVKRCLLNTEFCIAERQLNRTA